MPLPVGAVRVDSLRLNPFVPTPDSSKVDHVPDVHEWVQSEGAGLGPPELLDRVALLIKDAFHKPHFLPGEEELMVRGDADRRLIWVATDNYSPREIIGRLLKPAETYFPYVLSKHAARRMAFAAVRPLIH